MLSKRRVFGALSLLIGIAAALLGAELLSTAWLTLRDGHYTAASRLFDNSGNTYIGDVTKEAGCRYVDSLFPHPYLAFVHHAGPPCDLTNINNVGLPGDDYPFFKRDDRYVVLLAGGSVASQLGQTYPRPAPRYLEEELNARYVSPNGKPFQVLNGGDGAWKQPQQTILLSLFADIVDAVVTLDGFNEERMMEPGTTQRFDTPTNNYFETNPIVARDSFGAVVTSWIVGRAVSWMGHGPLRHSHAAYLIADGLSRLAPAPDYRTSINFYRMTRLPPEITSSPDRLFSWQQAQYRKYVRVMEATARGFGLKSMFFLQPVPAIDKILTPAEKQATPDLSYAQRYRDIVADLKRLNADGIAVRSLLDVFAGERRTIYEDWIHPYRSPDGESLGYRLIAARMASEMAEGWGLLRKP